MIRQLEPDLFLIDHKFQGVPGTIASYLLTAGDDLTLIETGPTTTTETLLAGVRAAGFNPDQITRLISHPYPPRSRRSRRLAGPATSASALVRAPSWRPAHDRPV